MNCIYCGTGETYVTDTVSSSKTILRRRKCKSCGGRFFSEERVGIRDYELRCAFWKIRKGDMTLEEFEKKLETAENTPEDVFS